MKSRLFLWMVVMLFSFVALAHAADVAQRIDNQQKRITEGISSGKLTKAEADLLNANLNWIRDRHNALKADGKLTPAEQQRLNKMLDDNSKMIEDKKKNPVKAFEVAKKGPIMQRIDRQQQRIDQGIASGKLTKAEADVLNANLNWIRDRRNALAADGKLTPAEQQRLNKMLDDNSKMIEDKKKNPVKRVN